MPGHGTHGIDKVQPYEPRDRRVDRDDLNALIATAQDYAHGGVIPPGWTFEESFPAVLTDSVDGGGSDYSDERYYADRVYLDNSTGDDTAAISWTKYSGGHALDQQITATNLAEKPTGSHLLSVADDQLVWINVFRDQRGVAHRQFCQPPGQFYIVAQSDYSTASDPPTVTVQKCEDAAGTNPSGIDITCGLPYLPQTYPNVRSGDVFLAEPDPSGDYHCIPADGSVLDAPIGACQDVADETLKTTLTARGWTVFATGKVLVGLDAGDADYDALGETGGSKDHTHDNGFGNALGHPDHGHSLNEVQTFEPVLEEVDTNLDNFTVNVSGTTSHLHDSNPIYSDAESLPDHTVSTENHIDPYEVVYHLKRTG